MMVCSFVEWENNESRWQDLKITIMAEHVDRAIGKRFSTKFLEWEATANHSDH